MSSSSNKAETSSSDEDNETAPSDGLNLAPADPDFDIFIGGRRLPRRYVTESDDIPWPSSSDDESEQDEPLSVITKPPPEHCKICSLVHSCWDNCHNQVCKCCASESHYSFSCPYMQSFPRGEKHDDKVYDVNCIFGCPFFDTDNWVCDGKYCSTTEAMLVLKECAICCSHGKHNTYDCTEDEKLAAEYYKFMKEAY